MGEVAQQKGGRTVKNIQQKDRIQGRVWSGKPRGKKKKKL